MKDVVIITGACGLIGSESVRFFSKKGLRVIGIDNDMRSYFFGPGASTKGMRQELEQEYPDFSCLDIDIRNDAALGVIFSKFANRIKAVIHTAAQPSHDWAASDPKLDFEVNATATLGLLELTRKHCPEAAFVFTSTNKVYGDTPNFLPLEEEELRYTCPSLPSGIDETMSIDQTKHSVFGASKVAADLMVQEYGRYFKMNTGVFRGGCLTGPNHQGAKLHGFLSYLVKTMMSDEEYTIFGYKGKQVRDNIHAFDLVSMFDHFIEAPRPGAVYNAGGGPENNVSVLEAIKMINEFSGKSWNKFTISNEARIGDHIWYVSNLEKFKRDYPEWKMKYSLAETLKEMIDACR